jgi:hypothetical protein
VNAPPSLGFWLQLIAVLAVGAAVIVCLAELLGRWTKSVILKRTLWQTALLGLAVLPLCELTGLANVARSVGRGAWSDGQGTRAEESASSFSEAHGQRSVGRDPGEHPDVLPADEQPEASDQPGSDVTPDAGDTEWQLANGEWRIGDSTLDVRHSEFLAWWPGGVWLAGLLLVAARVFFANLLLFWFRRRHPRTSNPVLAGQVERIAANLGFHRRVRILEGARLSGPVAFGIFRPTLALPASFTRDFDAAQQEVMLAHELAHLAGRDPCWHLLADLLSALWWWHPLVWWSRHQLHAASEAAADEASLIVVDGPGVLASCLVALGTQLVERRQPGWLRMAGSGFRSSLGRRVERLLELKTAPVAGTTARAWLTLSLGPAILLAAALASTAWARTSEPEEGDPNMKQSWKRSLAGLMLLSTLAASDTPSAGEEPQSGEQRTRTKNELNIPAPDTTLPLRLDPLIVDGSTSDASDVVSLNAQKFRLPFQVDPGQAPTIRELRLYDSTDKGTTWQHLGVAKLAERAFTVSVGEGLHWFAIGWVDKDGKHYPELSKLQPSVKVVVRSGQNAAPAAQRSKAEAGLKSDAPDGDSRESYLKESADALKKELDTLRAEYVQMRNLVAPGGTGAERMDRLDVLKSRLEEVIKQKEQVEAELKALQAKRTRVFRLTHSDPQEVHAILAALLQRSDGGQGARPWGAPTMGAGPGGMAPPGMMPAPANATWRIVADTRTNTLIIRGRAEDIQAAADIIALLDASPEKPAPRVKNLKLFKLRFARAEELASVLHGLGIDARMVPVTKDNSLLVYGSEESSKEIRDLIAVLDVDVDSKKPKGGSGKGGSGDPAGGPN